MGRHSLNLLGKKFGLLSAVSKTERRSKAGDIYWLFKCDCGNLIEVTASQVNTGATYNCGCLCGAHLKKHGKAKTRTYSIWAGMWSRIKNPNSAQFHNYGGRGIKVCTRWYKFENFLADMGECPAGKSLDRLNVNGNYEPENCRWATTKEQGQTMRKTLRLYFKGTQRTLHEIPIYTGLTELCIYKRHKRGLSGDALGAPRARRGGKMK